MKRRDFIEKSLLGGMVYMISGGSNITISDLPPKLKKIKKKIFDVIVFKGWAKKEDYKTFNWNASFMKELGLDSLDTVELVMTVEKRFAISIPDVEFDNFDTPNDLLKIVLRQNPKKIKGFLAYDKVDFKGDASWYVTNDLDIINLKNARYLSFKVFKGTKVFFLTEYGSVIGVINAIKKEVLIPDMKGNYFSSPTKKDEVVLKKTRKIVVVNCLNE